MANTLNVVAFLEPPPRAIIKKILRHCGLWHPSTPRVPLPEDGWVYEPDAGWENQPISMERGRRQAIGRPVERGPDGICKGSWSFLKGRDRLGNAFS